MNVKVALSETELNSLMASVAYYRAHRSSNYRANNADLEALYDKLAGAESLHRTAVAMQKTMQASA